ncbi:MAG: hypothetical protein AUK48_01865 [Oscillatoriales cyanobacterium CG2_30_44_21]|nr:MAG: hypothetical protein AUK48_01865 [Oscillatoriales cyanobacterium CG2_30_44_21]
MIPALEHPNESERLESLYQCSILDTEPEQGFDDITQLAAYTCQTPIALVSLLDKDRQWFKARVGLSVTETPRRLAFCAHAILQDGIFIIPDTLKDERFANNPLVVDSPNIRFYAGVPIKTSEGHPIGTLCVIDRQPRELNKEQISCLKSLARQVAYMVATRRSLAGINHSLPIASALPRQFKDKFIRKVALWTGLAALMVMGISFISFVNLSNVQRLNTAALEQREKLNRINQPLDLLQDLKVELSNYILTNDSQRLARYEVVLVQLRQDLESLQILPKLFVKEQNSGQLDQRQEVFTTKINLLSNTINQEIDELQNLLLLQQTSGIEATRNKLIDINNDDLIGNLHLQLDDLIKLENQSLENHLQMAKLSASNSVNISMVTLISTLIVLGLLFYLVNKEDNIRRELRYNLEQERDFTITVLDNVKAIVIVLDSSSNIIRFNSESEAMSGYRYEEVRNQSFYKIFRLEHDTKLFNQDIEQTTRRTFSASYENEWKTKNGETRTISWSATALLGKAEASEFMIVTGLDVTDSRQSEDQIRLQNWRSLVFSKITLRIRQSLDISEILNTTVNEVRRFLSCDRVIVYQIIDTAGNGGTVAESVAESVEEPWAACLGADIVDTCFNEGLWDGYRQGRKVINDDVSSSDMPDCYKNLMARFQIKANLVVPILESDRFWGLLIAHQCSDTRHWRKFEVDFVSEIGSQVGIALYQAMLLDRETQRREQLSQKNQELEEARHQAEMATKVKSSFLATMSHEIRTPMNAVLGMTGLLADSHLSVLQRDFVDTIRLSGENLLTLINEILDFSKLEANEMELEEINFNLNTSVDEVTDLLAMMAQSKGLELAALIYQNVPLHLCGDVGRLRQILINLIGNAIKFTATGDVIVKVTLREQTETTATIEFRIIDTGIGISPEAQQKLFQPFTQVDSSTTRKYGGTGLGLAICKQIVELMGGEIGIESEEGKGSQFWFTIPFDRQSSEMIAQTKPHREVNLRDIRVLVVDDSEANCKILTYQLTAWQMRVDAVQRVSDAIAVMRTALTEGDPYKLAILDMQMPELDGEMLGAQIKADTDLRDTKLIMLTSLSQYGGINRVRDLGFEYYLVKPVKQSRLLEVLMDVVVMCEVNPSHSNYLQPNLPKLSDDSGLASNSSSVQKFSKLKILIAEDSPINQKVALHQLRSFGYDADVAGNGKEALNLLEQIDYHLILMDCQMPELDGYETTQAIRGLDSDKNKVVIVAMTANAMKEDRDRCIMAGMDDYLSKPIRKEDLAQKLAEWEMVIFTESKLEPEPNEENEPAEQVLESAVPLIDWSYINDIDSDEDFKNELLQTFCESTEPMLVQLSEAIASEDYIQVKRIAHFIKGSSANIGITSMAAIASSLEHLVIDQATTSEDKIMLTSQMHQSHQKLQDLLLQVSQLIR